MEEHDKCIYGVKEQSGFVMTCEVSRDVAGVILLVLGKCELFRISLCLRRSEEFLDGTFL